MALIDKIDADLTEAMKAGQSERTATLRLLKNSLKNEQIKLGHELSDDQAQAVLRREAKQRRESIEVYKQGGRAELAESENHELEVIQQYLPQAMSESELKQLVQEVVDETGAKDLKQMGMVIGTVLQRAGGRADGSEVSRLVKAKLQ